MNLQEKIHAAFAASDAPAILNVVNDGSVALDWRDDAGRTLMHYAAAFGMRNVAEELCERGALALVFDDAGLRPLDVARAFGYAGAINVIWAQHDFEIMHVQEKMPYDSMDAIRAAGAMEDMIRRGFLPQVCALAQQDGFTAADFLAPAHFSRTVLDTLCYEEMLWMVLKPELWHRRPDDFAAICAALPQQERKRIDVESFCAAMRQNNLQSRPRPRLGGGPSV